MTCEVKQAGAFTLFHAPRATTLWW